MSGDLLGAVVAAARRSADEREKRVPLAAVERVVASQPSLDPRAFGDALSAPGIRIIAECKRRSPSRGVLRDSYDPAAIARSYEHHGAAAISVLTEPTFFDGSLDHLREVRAGVRIPVLRKDFIVTKYQVAEAAAIGANAVLLIVAALDDEDLAELGDHARAYGLSTLVEVHDRDELTRAIDSGAAVIGVNSRNLRTLTVDQGVLDALGPAIPRGVVAVAESGLKTPADLSRLRGAGYHAFLMGERFMTTPDPGSSLGELRLAATELVL